MLQIDGKQKGVAKESKMRKRELTDDARLCRCAARWGCMIGRPDGFTPNFASFSSIVRLLHRSHAF